MSALMLVAQLVGLAVLFFLAAFGLVTLVLTVYDKPWSGMWKLKLPAPDRKQGP
jgi:hypothetical protein